MQIERVGGSFVLAAIAVPEADYERVAGQVNRPAAGGAQITGANTCSTCGSLLATETWPASAGDRPHRGRDTGLKVHAFPKERGYFVEMKAGGADERDLSPRRNGSALIVAVRVALPRVPRPITRLPSRPGWRRTRSDAAPPRCPDGGAIRRIGAAPNHAIGWTANGGMTVVGRRR